MAHSIQPVLLWILITKDDFFSCFFITWLWFQQKKGQWWHTMMLSWFKLDFQVLEKNSLLTKFVRTEVALRRFTYHWEKRYYPLFFYFLYFFFESETFWSVLSLVNYIFRVFLKQILCYSANTMLELLTELELDCVIKAPSIYTSCLHRQEYDLMKAVRVPTSNTHSLNLCSDGTWNTTTDHLWRIMYVSVSFVVTRDIEYHKLSFKVCVYLTDYKITITKQHYSNYHKIILIKSWSLLFIIWVN